MFRKRIGWCLLILLAMICQACQSRSEPGYQTIFSMATPAASERVPTGPDAAQSNRHQIAFVAQHADLRYFRFAAEGALEAGNELDVDVQVLLDGSPTAGADEQIRVVEKLIEQQVDLIAISASDPGKLTPVLQRARSHGIRVLTWDADTLLQGREYFIQAVDPETIGRHLMGTMAEAIGEEGAFAVIAGSSFAANTADWLKWLQIQQKEYFPNIKLAEVVTVEDRMTDANNAAVRELLLRHPALDGIVGISPYGSSVFKEAMKANDPAGRIKIVELASPGHLRSYLKDGTVYAAAGWSPKKLGYLTIRLAANLLDGEEPSDGQDVPGVGKIRMVGRTIIMGDPLEFTKENVDQYDF